MKNKIILLLPLLFIGCRPSSVGYSHVSQMIDSSETIDVTQAILNPEKTRESTFDSVRLTFLETNEHSILSQIRDALAVKNRIIVRDQYNNGGVAIFDTSGKFITRLPHGEASYELGHASKIFCLDEFLYVHDAVRDKFLKYTLDGEFVSCIYSNIWLDDFVVINGDLFFLSLPGQKFLHNFAFTKFDTIPENCQVWDLGTQEFDCCQESYFQVCKNAINITMPWNGNVYCYKDGAVYKKYTTLNKSANLDFSEYTDIIDMLKRLPDGVFVNMGIYLETADFQWFLYAGCNYLLKDVFRCKKSGYVWTNNFTKNSLLNSISILNVADYRTNTFLGLIPAEALSSDNPDYHWDGSNPNNLISPEDMEKLKSVKPDDNPIIVLFKLKSEI